MSAPTPPNLPPPNPAAPAKKISPLVWILGGVAVLLFGVMLTCGLGGFLFLRAVKNATGFDADLMRTNPGLAMTKMAAALHPDFEIVSSNDRTGTIIMKEKSTGKIMTYRFDPDQKTLVMSEDGKEVRVSATGDGNTGSVEVKSAEGTMRFGTATGNTAPAWVPVYPGSTPEGNYSADTAESSQNSFSFKTKDAAGKVISYYQEQFKTSGFTVNLVTTGDQGGMVQAEDGGKKRTVMVTVGSSSEGTQGNIVAIEKK